MLINDNIDIETQKLIRELLERIEVLENSKIVKSLNSEIKDLNNKIKELQETNYILVGPTNHVQSTSTSETGIPLDIQEIHTNGAYFETSANAIRVLVAGYYNISGNILQHCSMIADKELIIYKNGTTIQRVRSRDIQWSSNNINVTAYFEANNTIAINAIITVTSNNYQAHSYNISRYTQIKIEYKGK